MKEGNFDGGNINEVNSSRGISAQSIIWNNKLDIPT